MAYRSQFEPLLRPPMFALVAAAIMSPFIAGCQSNAQNDLVARELRMQEDQIYALEDYLAEYQQLLCKMREENAALRNQLTVDGDADADELPRPSPRTRNGQPATPTLDDSEPEIEMPDVPPLQKTSSTERVRGSKSSNRKSIPASTFSDPSLGSVAMASASAVESTAPMEATRDAWLHGEVVENETGGGPRLMVDVEPLDEEGRVIPFTGGLSLMLLDPAAGSGQCLARWDFAPDDVQAARQQNSGGDGFRFYLELEPNMPPAESTQIWVRLLPQGGQKVLACADIDLTEPGTFASFPQVPISQPMPVEPAAETARSAEAPLQSTREFPPVTAELYDAGWSIARPGEPALLEEADEADTGWRASLEPMPIPVAHSRPARSAPRVRRTESRRQTPKIATTKSRSPSSWSPDRAGDEPTDEPHVAATRNRPRWSATR